MERQAALRFAAALRKKWATLTGGQLHTQLDLLCRVQFFEGLTKRRFNTISLKAAVSKQSMVKALKQMMLELDPTLPASEATVTTDYRGLPQENLPSTVWLDDTGPIGLYRAAWTGAQRIFDRTKLGLEASDLLSEVLMKALSPEVLQSNLDRLLKEKAEAEADPDSIDRKRFNPVRLEDLEEEQELLKQIAISEAAEKGSMGGNFFWQVGYKLSNRAHDIFTGKIDMAEVKGMVAKYASSRAMDAVKSYMREATNARKLIEQGWAPSDEEFADFDYTLDSLSDTGWNKIVQWVLENPTHELSREMIDWLVYDISLAMIEGKMSDRDGAVIRIYVDDFVRTDKGGSMQSYAEFIRYFNNINMVGETINAQDFQYIWNKYLKHVHKRLEDDPPTWYTELADMVFLHAAQKGKGRFASSDQVLRAKITRLAHSNRALRPHLLPLIK